MRFADHLRSWTPEALTDLLTARPDLVEASDEGFSSLAREASSPVSLSRCLIRADVGMLVVIDAVVLLERATADEIDELLGTGDVTGVIDALDRLRRRGLVTIVDGVVRPADGVDELIRGPLALGRSIVELWPHLGPLTAESMVELLGVDGATSVGATARAVAARMAQPAGLATLLQGAPEGTDEVLEALCEQRAPAVGLPAGHLYRGIDEYDPLSWMLGRGLLVATDEGLAELPREVVLATNTDGLAPTAALRPINVQAVTGLDADAVAAAAADQAARALEAAEALVRLATDGEIAVRKSGGVGVREINRLAKQLDLEARDVARLLEMLDDARLVAPGHGAVRPTGLEDMWWSLPRPRRWLVLLRGWMGSVGFPSYALSRDDDGSQRPALGAYGGLTPGHAARETVLAAIAALGPGTAFEPEQLTEVVVWQSPHLWGLGEPPHEELVAWTLQEAELLGVVALDAPTSVASALIDDDGALEQLAVVLLGTDQDQVILQSDLTAVALGPLDPTVAGKLADIADRVSGLSVPTYRFTEPSLRRGFDRGWTAALMTTFLEDHALSGVPQPLGYLIADVDRRYGSVKVLSAMSVVVTESEAIAIEIASKAKAAKLGLRLVAPTVLVSSTDPVLVLEELRDDGYFPVLDESRITVGPRRRFGATSDGSLDGSLEALDPLDGASMAAAEIDGLPVDWTGPTLYGVQLPGAIEAAVDSLLDDRGPPGDEVGPAEERSLRDRVDLFRSRAAVVTWLRDGELVDQHGTVLAADSTLTMLNDGGIVEIPVSSIVSIDDPSR
ncbi:MAG: helicase-associated domain-containing protein [Acidimicrobiales bacterium]